MTLEGLAVLSSSATVRQLNDRRVEGTETILEAGSQMPKAGPLRSQNSPRWQLTCASRDSKGRPCLFFHEVDASVLDKERRGPDRPRSAGHGLPSPRLHYTEQ